MAADLSFANRREPSRRGAPARSCHSLADFVLFLSERVLDRWSMRI
jgi:hypothetical protein